MIMYIHNLQQVYSPKAKQKGYIVAIVLAFAQYVYLSVYCKLFKLANARLNVNAMMYH